MGIRDRILRRDHWTCRWCGAPAGHVDHVVPLKLGGTDDDTNLVAACEKCNLSRGARPGPPPALTRRRPGW